MKVLHVITDLDVGGAEKLLTQAAPLLAQRDVEQFVVSLSKPGVLASVLTESGIPVESLNMRAGRPDYHAYQRLRQIIRTFQPDLIHSWLYHADFYATLASKGTGIPLIWGLHNATLSPNAKLSTRLIVRFLANASKTAPRTIISCSQTGAESHGNAGYKREIMTFIPNGFDTRQFQPDPDIRTACRAALGIGPDEILIGNISRFDAQKDHKTLIAALRIVAQADPSHKIRFLLAGKGLDQDNSLLVQWLESAGLAKQTLLLGIRQDVPALLNALDLFVLSSIGEAFPLVLGEAMSCGVCCVSTDAGDAAYLLGEFGQVVPHSDAQALAQAIQEVLALSELEKVRWQVGARKRIVESFSLEKMCESYFDVYKMCTRKD